MTLYNYYTFKNKMFEIKNNIKREIKDLITIKEIIINNKVIIIKLIEKGIIKNESKLFYYEEKGDIYNKNIYYLQYNKNKKENKNDKERNEISNRIKIAFFQAIIDSLNSFDEMKNNPIEKLSRNTIYTITRADFNLRFFNKKFIRYLQIIQVEEIIMKILRE